MVYCTGFVAKVPGVICYTNNMTLEVMSDTDMKSLGERIGALLRGGEVIELVGDVGAGKTTLTKGICRGAGVHEDVQSPTFTLSRVYDANDGLQIVHYDFYRLHDPGVMALELRETAADPHAATIVEWADVVKGVLPEDRLVVHIVSPTETSRRVEFRAHGPNSTRLRKELA